MLSCSGAPSWARLYGEHVDLPILPTHIPTASAYGSNEFVPVLNRSIIEPHAGAMVGETVHPFCYAAWEHDIMSRISVTAVTGTAKYPAWLHTLPGGADTGRMLMGCPVR